MVRKSWDQHFMNIALECSTMSTCIRRHVGCVLTDEEKGILSTGFNGPPSGWEHCDPQTSRFADLSDIKTCSGADAPPGLSNSPKSDVVCVSNHAERNALGRTHRMLVHTCYCTTEPCLECTKTLLTTRCVRIVYLEKYPGPSRDLWLRKPLTYKSNGVQISLVRKWEQLCMP